MYGSRKRITVHQVFEGPSATASGVCGHSPCPQTVPTLLYPPYTAVPLRTPVPYGT